LLYLVGGPARSGKSLLAQRLLRQRQIPYFSVDYLTSGLARGAATQNVRHEQSNRDRGERIWPVLSGVLRNIVEVEPHYLVEGGALLPEKVVEFSSRYPGAIRACFLGYAHSTAEAKCASIRATPAPINDWVAKMSCEELVRLVSEMGEFSAYLEKECARLHIPYFDGSADFNNALNAAQLYLQAAA
jgi:hypothetical protein